MDYSYIERNTAEIKAKIAEACALAGRPADSVKILSAVKYADAEEINYLHTVCGIDYIGENRVQQLTEHLTKLDTTDMKIHFIGTLQTNKVKYIIDKVDMIESLDSDKLAAEIDRQAARCGRSIDVLCEINSGRETSKSGVLPDEVEDFCLSIAKYPHLNLRGFMTMAPVCEEKSDYRKYFAQTYALALDIWQKKLHNIERPVISMGMSGSYEEAILEGADIVRIGRGFFIK